eukprot:g76849.t1
MHSMYYKKKYNVTVNVTTFGATGAACFPRLLWSDANYLDDMTPSDPHNQITDYANPFDPYGSGLGIDIGRTCYYTDGATPNASKAYFFCEQLVGYTGSYLTYIANGPESTLNSAMVQDKQNYQICRYLTHDIHSVYAALTQNGTMLANGSTNLGCVYNPVIDAGDKAICPSGECDANCQAFFWGTVGGIVLIVVIVICGFCCILVALFKFCKRKLLGKPDAQSQKEATAPGDAVHDALPEATAPGDAALPVAAVTSSPDVPTRELGDQPKGDQSNPV